MRHFEHGLFLGLGIGVFFGSLISGLLAYDAGVEKGKALAPPQKLVIQVKPAATLIECDLAGRLEYDRICRARNRMTKVGQ